jgi:hypothetical protein
VTSQSGDRSNGGSCKGPWPCPGCGVTIDSREEACSPCALRLPPELKIGLWKCRENLPAIVYGELLPKVNAWLRANPVMEETG